MSIEISGHISKITAIPRRPKVPAFYRIVVDVPKLAAVQELDSAIDQTWTISFEPKDLIFEEPRTDANGVPRDYNMALPVMAE